MRTATLFDPLLKASSPLAGNTGGVTTRWDRRAPRERDARERAASPAPERAEGSPAMSRDQLYDHILTINPSAGRAFLEQFDERKLGDYLDRLQISGRPRGRESVWVRRSPEPAVAVSGWER